MQSIRLALYFSLLISITAFQALAETRVAIIGAGFSGLSAAYELKQKGVIVDVYEARLRVGGRVHSAWMDNPDGTVTIAEFGAQNVSDGGDADNIRDLAEALGLSFEICAVQPGITDYQDGRFQDPSLAMQIHLEEQPLNQILAELNLMRNNPRYVSMEDVLDALFPKGEILSRTFTSWLQGFEGAPPSVLWPAENVDALYSMIAYLAGLSQKGPETLFHPIEITSFVGGNSVFAVALAEHLEGQIHLNKVLTAVDEGPDGVLDLYFSDGTHTHCDQLILSIPTPIYADIKFEESVIAAERLAEFALVEPGTASKILVPASTKTSWLDDGVFLGNAFVFSCGEQAPLNFYVSGSWGESITADKDERFLEVANAVHAAHPGIKFPQDMPVPATETMFAHYNQAVVKGWVEDPFAKGSYSSFGSKLKNRFGETIDCRGVPVKSMFAPIDDRIFFIGEHTTLLHEAIGTMEAAVESGRRIARLW